MVIPDIFKKKSRKELIDQLLTQGTITGAAAPFPSGFQPSGIQAPPKPKAAPGFLELPTTPPPEPTKVITDEKGRLTGIETPSGKVFTGLKPSEVRGLMEKERQRGGEIVGAEEFATEEARERARAERLAAVEADIPGKRELDPFRFEEEKFPILGGTFSALSNIGKRIVKALGLPTESEEFIKPEELRTLALTQIEKQEIERGLTASEEWGAFVEGIGDVPFVGKTLTWGTEAEKPSQNVQTIIRDLKAHKQLATDQELLVRQGILSRDKATEVIDQIELDIQRLESRIKLLVNSSPDLKFNSDGVNFIETKIFQARNRVFQVKLNIAAMEPGTIADPTEIQMLMALKGEISAEDFTIPGLE